MTESAVAGHQQVRTIAEPLDSAVPNVPIDICGEGRRHHQERNPPKRGQHKAQRKCTSAFLSNPTQEPEGSKIRDAGKHNASGKQVGMCYSIEERDHEDAGGDNRSPAEDPGWSYTAVLHHLRSSGRRMSH